MNDGSMMDAKTIMPVKNVGHYAPLKRAKDFDIDQLGWISPVIGAG